MTEVTFEQHTGEQTLAMLDDLTDLYVEIHSGRWSDSTPPPGEVLESSKFAVIELDVRRSHRGQGLGGKLLEKLLEDRPEKYATLAAIPNSLAHGMYVRR